MKEFNRVVVIKDMSGGNESVGEMWQETKIFDINDPIKSIIDWSFPSIEMDGRSRKRITITIPEE